MPCCPPLPCKILRGATQNDMIHPPPALLSKLVCFSALLAGDSAFPLTFPFASDGTAGPPEVEEEEGAEQS